MNLYFIIFMVFLNGFFCIKKEKQGTTIEPFAQLMHVHPVVDIKNMETEFNSLFKINHRVHSSSIYTDEESRINYAYIEIRDSAKFTFNNNQITAEVPLIAEVSYSKWQTIFGKKNVRDTILKDIEIELALKAELYFSEKEDLSLDSNIRVEIKSENSILMHIRDIDLFSENGKFSKSFERIILRNTD